MQATAVWLRIGLVALVACALGCTSSDESPAPPAVDAAIPIAHDSGSHPVDANVADVNSGDSNVADSNVADSNAEDSSVTDTGVTDSNVADTNSTDAGVDGATDAADSSITDAGAADATDAADSNAPDACSTNHGGCDTNAACADVDGGAVCTCNAGWVPNGPTACLSACLTNNGGCDPNATCSNGVSGVVCACNPGFTGTGTNCFSNDYVEWPAPSDSPLESVYSTSSDGILVADSVTNLVWQRQVFANPCPGDGAGVCTWQNAQTYCASLDSLPGGGLGGLTGWRLPSIVELLSIMSFDVGPPWIATSDFPATPIAAFWARTPDASNASQAWVAHFGSATTFRTANATLEAVRCVTSSAPVSITPTCGLKGLACCYANSCGPDLACSGGTCVIANDYVQAVPARDSPSEASSAVSNDGAIVTDSATGLRWQRQLFANPCPGDGAGLCTWAHAQAYCASLDSVGLGNVGAGWRLPSVTELISIVNYSAGAPWIDTALFPATPASGATSTFWAGTPNASNPAQAWAVNFANGSNSTYATTAASAVRCVSEVAPSSSTATCGLASDACCYANSCGPDLACGANVCTIDPHYEQSLVPSETPSELGYTVSPGGTVVKDGATGLVWQRRPLTNPCPGDGGPCTWANAGAYCGSLNGLAVGGLSAGWRLPTAIELLSIANYAGQPFIDPAPFPSSSLMISSFWSGTTYGGSATQAYSFSYASGTSSVQATTAANAVRCVNAAGGTIADTGCGSVGQSCCYGSSCGATLACLGGSCVVDVTYSLWPLPTDTPTSGQYAISGDASTATDSVTGLVWARFPSGVNPCPSDGTGVCTWANATTFCATLNGSSVGGLSSGWRLASLSELLSIVRYDVTASPFVDQATFPNVSSSTSWTSTRAADGSANAWTIYFGNGTTSLAGTTATNAPRCVNGG